MIDKCEKKSLPQIKKKEFMSTYSYDHKYFKHKITYVIKLIVQSQVYNSTSIILRSEKNY